MSEPAMKVSGNMFRGTNPSFCSYRIHPVILHLICFWLFCKVVFHVVMFTIPL